MGYVVRSPCWQFLSPFLAYFVQQLQLNTITVHSGAKRRGSAGTASKQDAVRRCERIVLLLPNLIGAASLASPGWPLRRICVDDVVKTAGGHRDSSYFCYFLPTDIVFSFSLSQMKTTLRQRKVIYCSDRFMNATVAIQNGQRWKQTGSDITVSLADTESSHHSMSLYDPGSGTEPKILRCMLDTDSDLAITCCSTIAWCDSPLSQLS